MQVVVEVEHQTQELPEQVVLAAEAMRLRHPVQRVPEQLTPEVAAEVVVVTSTVLAVVAAPAS